MDGGKPHVFTRAVEAIAHLGVGELFIRAGMNVLAALLVLAVVWLMQVLYNRTNLNWNSALAGSQYTPAVSFPVDQLPVAIAYNSDGIGRQAVLHTTIPTRPRIEVIKYTVQVGDSVFKIAEKFGLKPTSILFGNYETLKDSPDLLRQGQVLNILPVDGTYYQWLGSENLSKTAQTFGVEADAIVNYPGNHLDPDTIGDLSHPNIVAGTWLVIPGGWRQFTSWTAPAQLVRENPTVRVWGPGVCSGINVVQVGYGEFVFPTVEHWLSGTNYRPDVNHYAVDFGGSLNNAVYAVDAGTVVYAGWNTWGYGNLIILDHGNGWQSLYGHLNQVNVSCGQNVGRGDVIGLLGSTGNSSGPHLHFELSYHGAHIDPNSIFNIGKP